MSTFFISDLHLSPSQPKLTEGLATFLTTIAKEAEALYILGDFFDAWIGDDDSSEFAQSIKSQLKDYANAGTKTFFLCGNRDFLVGDLFCNEAGLHKLEDVEIHDIYGQKTLLMHGDTLCTEDAEYQQFRAMVHSEPWQAQVLSLPLEKRREMAQQLREQSKSMSSMKAEDIMDVTPSEVDKVLRTNGTNLLIHGHTHRPYHHKLANGDERIVLGDWGEFGWYIEAQKNSSPALKRFTI